MTPFRDACTAWTWGMQWRIQGGSRGAKEPSISAASLVHRVEAAVAHCVVKYCGAKKCSKLTKTHLRIAIFQNFSGGACPQTPLAKAAYVAYNPNQSEPPFRNFYIRHWHAWHGHALIVGVPAQVLYRILRIL